MCGIKKYLEKANIGRGCETSQGTHLEPHLLEKWVNFSVPGLLNGVHEVEDSAKVLDLRRGRALLSVVFLLRFAPAVLSLSST